MSKMPWIALIVACGICQPIPSDLIAQETKHSHLSLSSITSRIKEAGREVIHWCRHHFYPKDKERIHEPLATARPAVEFTELQVSKKNTTTTRTVHYKSSKRGKSAHKGCGCGKRRKQGGLEIRGERSHGYKRPDYISKQVWKQMEPNFLPYNHPLRPKLDEMFGAERLIASSDKLTEAGFYGRTGNRPGRFSNAIVASHLELRGYIVKLFADDSPHQDWPQLKKRVEGAKSLRQAIQKHGWQHWFKVPNKWIYPLPESPAPEIVEGTPVKGFILVAEDMMIYKHHHNYRRWITNMSRPKLDALYVLLQEEGLIDSPLPFNIPFCLDGKIAFIDLEHNHVWPVPFYKLQPFLRDDLQGYWHELYTKGTPALH